MSMNNESPTIAQISRELWLNYFNDYLLEKGMITQDKWLRLKRRIDRTAQNKGSTAE